MTANEGRAAESSTNVMDISIEELVTDSGAEESLLPNITGTLAPGVSRQVAQGVGQVKWQVVLRDVLNNPLAGEWETFMMELVNGYPVFSRKTGVIPATASGVTLLISPTPRPPTIPRTIMYWGLTLRCLKGAKYLGWRS